MITRRRTGVLLWGGRKTQEKKWLCGVFGFFCFLFFWQAGSFVVSQRVKEQTMSSPEGSPRQNPRLTIQVTWIEDQEPDRMMAAQWTKELISTPSPLTCHLVNPPKSKRKKLKPSLEKAVCWICMW